MITSFDKAWVSALVTIVAVLSMKFFNFEMDTAFQVALGVVISGVISFIATYMIPNKGFVKAE